MLLQSVIVKNWISFAIKRLVGGVGGSLKTDPLVLAQGALAFAPASILPLMRERCKPIYKIDYSAVMEKPGSLG